MSPADTPATEARRPVHEEVPAEVLARAGRVAQRTGHALLTDVLAREDGTPLQLLNNALMDVFRVHADAEAYTLLFELNARPFSLIAMRIMRMTGSRGDLNDILQEAFLAIYRYPSRFCAEKPNAFRNWSYSIIRNTVYRSMQISSREEVPVDLVSDILPDERAGTPASETVEAESTERCRRVLGLVLCLYNDIYERDLKDRDRLALQLVEIDGLGYREAADRLDVRLENFKMIVCRARKKIFQSLVRILGTRPS